MPLRILVVDDHAVVRRGVRSLLESHEGWDVCGEATTGRDRRCEGYRPKARGASSVMWCRSMRRYSARRLMPSTLAAAIRLPPTCRRTATMCSRSSASRPADAPCSTS